MKHILLFLLILLFNGLQAQVVKNNLLENKDTSRNAIILAYQFQVCYSDSLFDNADTIRFTTRELDCCSTYSLNLWKGKLTNILKYSWCTEPASVEVISANELSAKLVKEKGFNFIAFKKNNQPFRTFKIIELTDVITFDDFSPTYYSLIIVKCDN